MNVKYIDEVPVGNHFNLDSEELEADENNFQTLIRAAKAGALVYGDATVDKGDGKLERTILISVVNCDGSLVPLAHLIPSSTSINFR